MKFSLRQQIEELDYELGQRRNVYPRIISREPRKENELNMHVDRLKAVKATLFAISLMPDVQEKIEAHLNASS